LLNNRILAKDLLVFNVWIKIINLVTRINIPPITTVNTLLRADAQLFILKNPAIPIKNRIIAKQKFIYNNEG
jgi:hypothetical protein